MCAKRFSFYAQNGVSSVLQEKHTFSHAFMTVFVCNVLIQQKTRCVFWNIELRSPTAVSECFRIFNNVNQHNIPSRKVIKNMVYTNSSVRTTRLRNSQIKLRFSIGRSIMTQSPIWEDLV
jgi:hypothetical protein